jgi:hypothetical protein
MGSGTYAANSGIDLFWLPIVNTSAKMKTIEKKSQKNAASQS